MNRTKLQSALVVANVWFRKYREYVFFISLTITIYLLSLYNYLLFHSVIELVGFMITYAIFLVFWNSRKAIDNDFFTFLGISFFFIGAIDLLHALAYSGMGVFPEFDANLPTQLWIVGRFLQSTTLLFALFCTKGKLKTGVVMIGLAILTAILMTLIFTGNFPACYVEGSGLTLFKKISEMFICLVYLAGLVLLYIKRSRFKRSIFYFISTAIIFAILAEVFFSFYFFVTDTFNIIGHLLRFISIYLFYRATVHVGFKDPLNLYFKNLQDGQKEKLQTLVDSLPEGIILLDENNNITLLNPLAKEYLPLFTEHNSPEGKLTTLIDEKIDRFFKPTSKGLRYHEVSVESDYRRTFQISGVETLNNDLLQSRILIFRDISIEYNLQEKVESSIRLAALGELAQGITHDFNNVMSTILGSTELALSFASDAETRKFLELIAKQAYKGSEIINQILDFTREKDVEPEQVNLKDITEEIIELAKTGIPSNISLETIFIDVIVLISRIQYQQVILNLVMNSKDAMKEGGIIKLFIERVDHTEVLDFEHLEIKKGEYAKITVEDTGIGMKPKTTLRAFEPFFTTKPRGEGTGLGLSQVYGITRQNNGYIYIKSAPDKGTTIYLFFPVEK